MSLKAYCWFCRKKTLHLVLNDGSEQAGQCLVCGNGFVWNIDATPHTLRLTKQQVEEYKASAKAFFGRLAWASRRYKNERVE